MENQANLADHVEFNYMFFNTKFTYYDNYSVYVHKFTL